MNKLNVVSHTVDVCFFVSSVVIGGCCLFRLLSKSDRRSNRQVPQRVINFQVDNEFDGLLKTQLILNPVPKSEEAHTFICLKDRKYFS